MEKGIFDDSTISRIGLGTWQLGLKGWGPDYNGDELVEALRIGIRNGLNFIDTAEVYGMGRSETLVGNALQEFDRKQYFVATKLAGFNSSSRVVRKRLTMSLRRLKLDYIDLYQVHWEPSIYTSIPELFRELENLADEGLISHIGVSNFSIKTIKKANESMKYRKVVSNQIKFNLVERPSHDLQEFMMMNDIKLIAWSPLAQGFLSGNYSHGNRPKGAVRRINRLFSEANFTRFAPLLEVLRDISEGRRMTPTQIALAYEKFLGVIPIPGFRTRKQVSEIIASNSISLSKSEIASIENALEKCGTIETSVGLYPRLVPNFVARIGALLI